MQLTMYYNIMPDGTVKQVNPFTGTEVWAVPGRRNKPFGNGTPEDAKQIEIHNPEDYCSFARRVIWRPHLKNPASYAKMGTGSGLIPCLQISILRRRRNFGEWETCMRL